MNNENIKEILDRLDYNEWEVDLYKVPITWDELYDIRDYITNLQQRCEYLERNNNRREDEIMSLRDECVDGETYKSRNKKAIEILKDTSVDMPETLLIETIDYARHILQGEDKDE